MKLRLAHCPLNQGAVTPFPSGETNAEAFWTGSPSPLYQRAVRLSEFTGDPFHMSGQSFNLRGSSPKAVIPKPAVAEKPTQERAPGGAQGDMKVPMPKLKKLWLQSHRGLLDNIGLCKIPLRYIRSH